MNTLNPYSIAICARENIGPIQIRRKVSILFCERGPQLERPHVAVDPGPLDIIPVAEGQLGGEGGLGLHNTVTRRNKAGGESVQQLKP